MAVSREQRFRGSNPLPATVKHKSTIFVDFFYVTVILIILMRDLNYFIQLGKLSEGIAGVKALLNSSDPLYKKLVDLEKEFCEEVPSYKFDDPENLLDAVPLSTYSIHEKQYFALAMSRFAEMIKQNVRLVECMNGTEDDKYKKIDFKIRVQGKEYSVQFKTRDYLSKKEFMDDVTIRDLDCLYGKADLLIEAVYDESSGTIVDQHFLNFKKLESLIDKKLLIDGKGRLEEWVLQPGRLKKQGEDNIELSAIRYNRGRSTYYYLPDGDRLGVDHHVYILPYAPGTSMVPLPIELLEKLDVGFDDPDILRGLL